MSTKKKEVKRTRSLCMDDSKVYQGSHQQLLALNEMLVQTSHNTGACRAISKCRDST